MLIKSIHVASVYISFIFFVTRYIWMIIGSPLLQHKLVKILPHVVDTVLLLSAIILVIQWGQYPFVDGWLTAKVLALLLYIVLGSIALKRGRNKSTKIVAGIAALTTFGFIISVAVTKQSLGFFAALF